MDNWIAPTPNVLNNAPSGPREGLSAAEVQARIREGEVNAYKEQTSRTYGAILRENIFTRFNAILGFLLIIILAFGSIKDALFGIVLIANALIGIIQEVRAKLTLDRLALVHAPTMRVTRDGRVQHIPVQGLVIDDIVHLQTGDQVAVDGTVFASEGLEVDESLLTGEAVPIQKREGDELYSGSFIVAGAGIFRVTKVGNRTYARRIIKEAKRFSLAPSELMASINTFLRYVTWALLAAAPFLFFTQIRSFGSVHLALPATVAGLVGMVPQGLVFLTSVVFAVAVVTLGRRRVLIQELPAVEILARVDVLCFDKTGTLTENVLAIKRVEKLEKHIDLKTVLAAFGESSSTSAVAAALAAAFPKINTASSAKTIAPFSSERKWSAVKLQDDRTWILGAPEVLLHRSPSSDQSLLRKTGDWAAEGFRVLLLGWTRDAVDIFHLPSQFSPAAFLLFEQKVRDDASETLNYFKQQGVQLKIISGDHPETVAAIAARAGWQDAREAIDARTLPHGSEALTDVLEKYSLFGRVTPKQKQQMVRALQMQGHVVAMAGDGVNDLLALKDADLGIAMGGGSPATKAVAQMVLLDDKFSTLPQVVAEGRKIIANIERVANLFLAKTAYIAFLVLAVGIVSWPFPFLPRHLTFIDGLTIGIPAFFLALSQNARRYHPGFMNRVLRFTLLAGFAAALATFTVYGVTGQDTTAALLTLMIIGFWIFGVLAKPFILSRKILLVLLVLSSAAVMTVPWARDFFLLQLPPPPTFFAITLTAGVAIMLFELARRQRRIQLFFLL